MRAASVRSDVLRAAGIRSLTMPIKEFGRAEAAINEKVDHVRALADAIDEAWAALQAAERRLGQARQRPLMFPPLIGRRLATLRSYRPRGVEIVGTYCLTPHIQFEGWRIRMLAYADALKASVMTINKFYNVRRNRKRARYGEPRRVRVGLISCMSDSSWLLPPLEWRLIKRTRESGNVITAKTVKGLIRIRRGEWRETGVAEPVMKDDGRLESGRTGPMPPAGDVFAAAAVRRVGGSLQRNREARTSGGRSSDRYEAVGPSVRRHAEGSVGRICEDSVVGMTRPDRIADGSMWLDEARCGSSRQIAAAWGSSRQLAADPGSSRQFAAAGGSHENLHCGFSRYIARSGLSQKPLRFDGSAIRRKSTSCRTVNAIEVRMRNKSAAASNVECRTGANMADCKFTTQHPPPKFKRPLRLLVRNTAVSEGSGKNINLVPPPVGIGKRQDFWCAI